MVLHLLLGCACPRLLSLPLVHSLFSSSSSPALSLFLVFGDRKNTITLIHTITAADSLQPKEWHH